MRFGRSTAVKSGDLPLIWLVGLHRQDAGAAGPFAALALTAAVAASAQSRSVDNTSTAMPVHQRQHPLGCALPLPAFSLVWFARA